MKSDSDKPKILSSNLFPVVGIGASAGGLEAFTKLIKAIPESSGMAFIFVQHLDPTHESVLPELLQRVTAIPIHEISDNIKVMPDNIYIIPSNKILVATDGVLQLSPRPPRSQRNMPIDVFFSSLAEVHQSHAIGVVLSGTATDGTLGLKAIKDYGGITFAQDKDSAAYDGMPVNAVQAGVVDFILAPEKIPEKLLELNSRIVVSDEGLNNIPPKEEGIYKQILALLHVRRGNDFTYYKQTTVRRRILRRMAINKVEGPSAYLTYLRENKTEQDVLYQDLLIPVTSFFRDQKIFDKLCETVFPNILKSKTGSEPIRVWVAGCSTGQEAYSIAICLKEFLDDKASQLKVQIFATDISEMAIAKARGGVYDAVEVEGLTTQRLDAFFTKNNGQYLLNKNVREACVFAVHNFLNNPPFAKIDVVSCRNALIYMEPYLQKKALTNFHYSLLPHGVLMLGKSETISSAPELFSAAEKQEKLFTRKEASSRFINTLAKQKEPVITDNGKANEPVKTRNDFKKLGDDVLLARLGLNGVIVNEAMDVVHFRGKTSKYLEQAEGKPTHNAIKMARPGLAFELRNLLHKAAKEKHAVSKESIPLLIGGVDSLVSIEAIPLPDSIEPHYLVLFSDSVFILPAKQSRSKDAKTKLGERDLLLKQLEQELALTREDMRSITEEQEAANEELQSSNEELLSGSEELQSLNEELETSKEEVQSSNEELTIVNQEMISLNEQLTEARNYAEAIITTIKEPLLVLDKNLSIKTANKAFHQTFGVGEEETAGASLSAINNGQWNIAELTALLQKVLTDKTNFSDFEVKRVFSNKGERTMLLNAREVVDGRGFDRFILLAFDDVTERVKLDEVRDELLHKFQTLVMQAPVAMCIFRGNKFVVELANESMLELWDRKAEQVMGKPVFECMPDLSGQGFEHLLQNVLITGQRFTTSEAPLSLLRNGALEKVFISLVYEPLREDDGTISGIMAMAYEITNTVLAKQKIEQSEFRYRQMIYSSPSLIAILKGEDYIITIANDAIMEVWGKGKDVIGKPFLKALPELVEQGVGEELDHVFTTGIPSQAAERPVSFLRDGKMELRYYSYVFQAQRSAAGDVEGIAIIGSEVTSQALANKAVKDSEERFRNVVEQAPSPICILKGIDMKIEMANDPMLKIWNVNREVLGKPLSDFMPEMKGQPFAHWLTEVFNHGITHHGNEEAIYFVRANGEKQTIYFNYVYLPYRENDDTISGVMVQANDVSEQVIARKKMEAQAQMVNDLLMNAPGFIATLIGPGHVYGLLNAQYQGLFGKRKIQGKALLEALPEIEGQGFVELLDTVYATGETYVGIDVPIVLARDEGLEPELRYFNFSYQPMYDEHKNIFSILVFGYEVTEQVVAKNKSIEDREAYATLLEQRVKERTAELSEANGSLNRKNEDLRKMNQELESFTYVSSHDLQEPLRKIQTFAARIMDTEFAVLSPTGKDYFNRMNNAAGRMQTLIQDLLEYSKTGLLDQKSGKADLSKLVEEVKTELLDNILQKGAVIEVGPLCNASINPFHFRQIMHNLISNSLKFSRPGIPVHITMNSDINNGSYFQQKHPNTGLEKLLPNQPYCCIRFSDNGIGFDEQYKQKIFEVFQRLHGKAEYEGTGIGLAIVKKIVENYSGMITADSDGKGATFTIYLPSE